MRGPARRDPWRASAVVAAGLDPERDAALEVRPPRGSARLNRGDPCFPTPEHIVDAIAAAGRSGYTGYGPARGDPELRQALAAGLSRSSPRTVSGDEVIVTAGAASGIYASLLALVDEGDEVLLFDPPYSVYAPILRQIKAVPILVQMAADFHVDADILTSAVTRRTRMIVVTNPGNPTGAVLSRAEFEGIARVADANDLVVLSDEVYDSFVFDGAELTRSIDVPALAERLVYVNSFSKRYAMTGWRLGYVLAPKPAIEAIAAVHRRMMISVSWPTQRGGIAALTAPQTCVEQMRKGYASRRAQLVEGLSAVPELEVPETKGALYMFPKFSVAQTSRAVTSELARAGVIVRSGTEFGPGGEGRIRVSYSSDPQDIEKGVDRIREVLSSMS